MDKLQPLLVHRFWICGGTAVIMSILGWWMSTSKLAAETEKRITEVKAAKGKAVVGPDAPNRIWVDQLSGVNKKQDKLVDNSREEMWVQQEALMKWPSGVARYMAGKKYREKSESAVQTVFQQFYEAERQRIRHILRPFNMDEDEGVVHFPIESLPAPEKYLNKQEWFAPLSWDELWDAAEDAWLIEDLVTSVNNVNNDYESVGDAPIRGIYRFELHGGQPRKLAEEEASADGTSGPDAGPGDGSGMGGPGGGGDGMMAPGVMPPGMGDGGGFRRPGGGGGASNQQSSSKPTITISAVEVFGSPTQVAAAAAEGGGPGGGPGGGDMGGSGSGGMGGAPMGVAPGVAPGGGEGSKLRRYVDDGDELPFKTRGFILGLVVHHDFVPKVIAELTASNWPVEIVRVHQQDFFEDPLGRGSADSGTGASVAGAPTLSGPSSSFSPSGRGAAPSDGGGPLGGGDEAMETSPILALFGGQQGGGGTSSMPGASPGAGRFGTTSPGRPGGFGPRPGVRPGVRPGGTSSAGESNEAEQPPGYQTLNAALNDRGLVRLEIAGLLTLYSPPQVKPEDVDGADGSSTTPGGNPTEPSSNGSPDTAGTDPNSTTPNGVATDPAGNGNSATGTPTAPPTGTNPPAGIVNPPSTVNPPAGIVNPPAVAPPNGNATPANSSTPATAASTNAAPAVNP